MAQKKGIDWNVGMEKRESFLAHVLDSRKFDQKTVLAFILAVLAIATPIFVLYRGAFGNIDFIVERSLIVTFVLLYCILKYPLGRKRWSDRINRWFAVDLFLILSVLAIQSLKFADNYLYGARLGTPWTIGEVRIDHIAGLIMIIVVLEATRRSFGWIMVAVPLALYVYVYLMPFLPKPFRGAGITWTYLMDQQFAFGNQGVYGLGTDVLLSMIFLYMLFGSILLSTKAGAFFVAIANVSVGRFKGGPAKAAVIGSSLIGMINGSAVANVMTSGCVTIPLMKRCGYSPVFAGAVEATASTGGQIMPPIMGVAAFLMAALLGISYFKIVLAAVIPALLYYFGVFMQVHFRAARDDLASVPSEEIPSLGRSLLEGGHLGLPVVIIVVALSMGYSVTIVGAWAIIGSLALSFIRKPTRLSPRGFLIALEQGTDLVAPIAAACIVVGLIVGTMSISGLGPTMTYVIGSWAAGNMMVGLILLCVVCIILGMGISTVLIYILSYAFAIPAIIALGAPVLSAHLFAFYFACIAAITPPVAMAAFVAASIAKADPMKIGWQATKLGVAAYIVPFIFVYRPELLAFGNWGDYGVLRVLLVSMMATLVVLCLASVFERWFITRSTMPETVLMFTAGAIIFYALLQAQMNSVFLFSGAVIVALVLMLQIIRLKKVAQVKTGN